MNCAEARAELLVADATEIVGGPATPLAMHLESCVDCRDAASMIVRGTRGLAVAVAGRAPVQARTAPRVALLLSAIPIAAAVVLAVALQVRSSSNSQPRVRMASLPVARHVSLEVSRGQRATVLKTADPKVTVIWLSSGEGK
jgi:hypothetical protein